MSFHLTLRYLDVPESVKGSRARLCRSLHREEGNQANEWPQNEGASLAHPVGHDSQECGTADSRQVCDVSRAEYHDDVENPTEGTGTDDGDKDGDRGGDGGLFHFFTDMGS